MRLASEVVSAFAKRRRPTYGGAPVNLFIYDTLQQRETAAQDLPAFMRDELPPVGQGRQ